MLHKCTHYTLPRLHFSRTLALLISPFLAQSRACVFELAHPRMEYYIYVLTYAHDLFLDYRLEAHMLHGRNV